MKSYGETFESWWLAECPNWSWLRPEVKSLACRAFFAGADLALTKAEEAQREAFARFDVKSFRTPLDKGTIPG